MYSLGKALRTRVSVLVATLRIQTVRLPLSFLTSAMNLPSAEKAMHSSVPVFVIWLTDIAENGTACGQSHQPIRHSRGDEC